MHKWSTSFYSGACGGNSAQLAPTRTPRDRMGGGALAVRTRREAIRAANALREQDLANLHTGISEMRKERTR